MKELRAEIRIKNNRLLRVYEQSGAASVREFCEMVGVSYTAFSEFVRLKRASKHKDGQWSPIALKLANYACCTPEYLFPPAIQAVKDAKTKSVELSAADVASLLPPPMAAIADPQSAIERAELRGTVSRALALLTPKEAAIVRARFGLEGSEEQTLSEVADDMDLSPERVRQTEAKALRKLRHPVFRRHLEQFVEGHDVIIPGRAEGAAVQWLVAPDSRTAHAITSDGVAMCHHPVGARAARVGRLEDTRDIRCRTCSSAVTEARMRDETLGGHVEATA